MKVISFKVSDNDYDLILKFVENQNLNFTKLFQPIAHEIVSRNKQGLKYTGVYSKIFSGEYQTITQIHNLAEKLLKSVVQQ